MEVIVLLAFLVGFVWLVRWMNANRATFDFNRQKEKLIQDKVVDQWSALINGASGQGEKIIGNVKKAVEEEKLPGVAVGMREMETEDKEKRPFLSVTNDRLKGYEMLVAAYDYGTRLNIVWYLTFDSPWALLKRKKAKAAPEKPKRHLNQWTQMYSESVADTRKAREEGGYADASTRAGYRDPEVMTMLEKQELQNYVGITHDVLKREVKAMMDGLNLDFSKVDTKSRGFLNVS